MTTLRVGCDIGGTFTDFLLFDPDDGSLRTLKIPTTPDDPSRAVLDGLAALAKDDPSLIARLGSVIHGTTLVINAVIERKGAPTALLATAGFPDILQMRREIRYDIYDLHQRFPTPLVPRRWRKEVPERILSGGAVETSLDTGAVAKVAAELAADGVTSLAIVFLHAYANDTHELEAAAAVRAAAPGLDVSLSSQVLPEIGEFERTATTVVNAYVRPLVERYLAELDTKLSAMGVQGKLTLMLSGGGTCGAEAARRAPVRLAESGPVGGAIAAAALGEAAGAGSVLAFDMGGTTAKLCLMDGGQMPVTRTYEVDRVHRFKRGSGTPIAVPTVDLVEIGAGGGSIARLDPMGQLLVGPESAGAVPGPIAYGGGGTEPTVTDANLVLGYLDPDAFRPRGVPLDRDGAEQGLMRVGEPLGLGVVETAAAVVAVVEEAMAGAARMHAVERGSDAAAATLVAYGGAGPLHADGIARRLGIRRVLVPPAAGVFSALGFLVSPVRFEAARSRLARLGSDEAASVLDPVLAALAAEARAAVESATGETAVTFERFADMAYHGQGHTLRVPLADGSFDDRDAAARFGSAYRSAYGYAYDDMAIQVVTVRVVATVDTPPAPIAAPPIARSPAPRAARPAYDPAVQGMADHTLVRFSALCPGEAVEGPALIEADGTTIRVGRGATATMAAGGWIEMILNLPASDAPAGTTETP
ncbi:MAG: hydantoinase/oxoprolinase family protein [Pseudomonadota bacterium]